MVATKEAEGTTFPLRCRRQGKRESDEPPTRAGRRLHALPKLSDKRCDDEGSETAPCRLSSYLSNDRTVLA